METISKHNSIQTQIIAACQKLGIETKQEYSGKDWRADVFIPHDIRPIVFEVQLSPQSLSKTLQRQAKYIRDGVLGCWLFENPVFKLNEERPDLPVFYVEEDADSQLMVNLGTRRKVDLQTFLEHFISRNIQFRPVATTNPSQQVKLVFYEFNCWKCKKLNHLYYVDTPFLSSCSAIIKPEEALWESNSIEYLPEIVELATNFVSTRKDLNLRLGHIKERFSSTVSKAYKSFGCHKCDSLFGDFYVMEAKLDVMDKPSVLFHQGTILLKQTFDLPIPHWCFPDNGHFCGAL